MKTRVKLEGEELERYMEVEKEKEKSRQVTEATDRRCVFKKKKTQKCCINFEKASTNNLYRHAPFHCLSQVIL